MEAVEHIEDPYFSIVIPVYNREQEIVRALNSCVTQSFLNFEVVVVDDASTDRTRETVMAFADPRIVLVTHEKNMGVCPARNTGISHSHGQWVLFLDSDDELLPGAVQMIFEKTLECTEDVERLGFLYQRDDGRFSPEPVPVECVLNYDSYVPWSVGLSPSDFFHCTRRRAFTKVRFPDSRAYELSYLLDFAKEYRTRMIPEVVAIIHMDSNNRDNNITDGELVGKFIREAGDEAAAMDYILSRHGDALSRLAPQRYRTYQKAQVLFSFLAGARRKGSKLAVDYLRSFPGCVEGWIILLAGLCGPQTLARVKVWKLRMLTTKRKKIARA